MLDLGFPYYFFGSPNSIDTDVWINHPHPSKTALEEIKAAHPATEKWNISLIQIPYDQPLRFQMMILHKGM
jgi:hypothetical protein